MLKTLALAAAIPWIPDVLSAQGEPVTGKNKDVHRIMTCNILLDLVEHRGTPNEWQAQRRALCEKVIKSRQPDILCLQEVGRGQNDDFIKAFPGFVAFGYPDPYVDANPPNFQACKNTILYSRDRYKQTSAGMYWLSATPQIAGSRLPGANLPRHVTWLRLKVRDNGREFRVLDTHWALQREIRLQQAKILNAEGTLYSADFPQLLCGDFNSDRSSPEHASLLEAGWKDTYETVHGSGEPGYTGHGFKGPNRDKAKKNGKIDFVFFRGNAQPLAAEIIRDSEDGRYPSDHYFVSADVRL